MRRGDSGEGLQSLRPKLPSSYFLAPLYCALQKSPLSLSWPELPLSLPTYELLAACPTSPRLFPANFFVKLHVFTNSGGARRVSDSPASLQGEAHGAGHGEAFGGRQPQQGRRVHPRQGPRALRVSVCVGGGRSWLSACTHLAFPCDVHDLKFQVYETRWAFDSLRSSFSFSLFLCLGLTRCSPLACVWCFPSLYLCPTQVQRRELEPLREG